MFKKVSAIAAAVVISITFSLTAFADNKKSDSKSKSKEKVTQATTIALIQTEPEPPQSQPTEEQTEPTNSLPDYLDDKYDTEGNASLIQSKKVIYDGNEMQFIAVTTKTGNVFYVLINHSDKDGENVYFLNKVDEYDLYALIHQDEQNDESKTPLNPEDFPSNDDGDTSKAENSVSEADNESKEESAEEGNSHSSTKSLLIIVGTAVVFGGAFVFIKKKDKTKSSKSISEDDYDLDFEEDEINEDDE